MTELEDGTGVVLNLDTKFYHTLNSTAVVLWKAIEGGISDEPALASRLVSEFEVGEEEARADVASALQEFEAEGLMVRAVAGR